MPSSGHSYPAPREPGWYLPATGRPRKLHYYVEQGDCLCGMFRRASGDKPEGHHEVAIQARDKCRACLRRI